MRHTVEQHCAPNCTSRAFPTFLHAAVHVLVGRFSRTPHLGWVAAMHPLCGHALLGFVASSSASGAAAFAQGSVQFSAQCCSTVSRITFQCSRVLASTNHSFCSPGTPLRVADHSVEMRSRGAGFKPPFLLAPVPRLSFSTFGRVYQCPGLFHGQIRSHGPQWQPPGLDQPLCRVKR